MTVNPLTNLPTYLHFFVSLNSYWVYIDIVFLQRFMYNVDKPVLPSFLLI